MTFDLPQKNVNELSEEDKRMMALMELGKAMSGADEEKPLLEAYISDKHIRVEQGGIFSTIQVSNLNDSTSYRLDTASKVAYRIPLASPKISSEMVGDSLVVTSTADRKIHLTEDTMTIAGYVCKKAIMEVAVGEEAPQITIWYAENLPKLFWGEYDYLEDIPGLTMKVSTKANGMDVGIKVGSVKETLVDNQIFEIPSDYTVEEDAFAMEDMVADSVSTTGTAEEADEEDFELDTGFHWTDDGELWGVEDDAGNVLIEPRYHDRYTYHYGLAAVSRDSLYGIIDKKGRELIPVQYEHLAAASEDRIWAMKGNLYGLIDTTNRILAPPRYQSASVFAEGLAAVEKDGKYGFVNEAGEEVIPCAYDTVGDFVYGTAWVQQGADSFYIDKKGSKVQ
ncbi:hypothetical protein GCM10023231_35420 [Olivibacter ginsenosidimutans]|uniref:WG repeat-containing protein n=2 Tax=Olivibacter ginsenosidimutans TaxID=1176537 RepID=A0ABP9C1Q1_9SPHI